jgi:RNA polymerase sigma factor (sigma-70 family)
MVAIFAGWAMSMGPAETIVNNEHQGVDALYQRYGRALMRKAQRLLGNAQDAEDIVQTFFVDMLARPPSSSDLPYLYRAVTNRCLNLIRDRKNHRRLLEKNDETLRGPGRIQCENRTIGLDLLLKLTNRLDAQSIEILVYYYFDDMAQEEISALLGLSRKTVCKRLGKIHEQVQGLLQGTEGAA